MHCENWCGSARAASLTNSSWELRNSDRVEAEDMLKSKQIGVTSVQMIIVMVNNRVRNLFNTPF